MKKNILLMFIFITMFFVGNNNVFAVELKCEVGEEGCTKDAIMEAVNKTKPNSKLACLYTVEFNTGKKFYNYIFYRETDDKLYAGSTLGLGDFHDLTKQDDALLLGNAYNNLYSNGICPSYSYINDDSSTFIDGTFNKICFANDINECVSKNSDFGSTLSSDLIENNAEILKYKSLTYNSSCNVNNLPSGFQNVCRYRDSDGNDVLLLYNGTTNKLIYTKLGSSSRIIIDEGMTKRDSKGHTSEYSYHDNYTNTLQSPINICPEVLYLNGYKTSSSDVQVGYNYKFETTKDIKATEIKKFQSHTCQEEGIGDVIEYSCEELIDGELRDIINDVMGIIRIVVPIMLIGLITYDFAMAVLSGADDKVSKLRTRAIKRIVIAVVIFFVPTFINLVFNMVNEVWGTTFSTCGITENN